MRGHVTAAHASKHKDPSKEGNWNDAKNGPEDGLTSEVIEQHAMCHRLRRERPHERFQHLLLCRSRYTGIEGANPYLNARCSRRRDGHLKTQKIGNKSCSWKISKSYPAAAAPTHANDLLEVNISDLPGQWCGFSVPICRLDHCADAA